MDERMVVNEDEKEKIDFTSAAEDGEEPQLDKESNLEHTLTKPIRAHGEEVRYLSWREPSAADIERSGNPIIIDFFGDKPNLSFNEKKMSAMISDLCGIPPSSVRQLTASDWNAIAYKLVRFFIPRAGG
jgi:hypothetical protein